MQQRSIFYTLEQILSADLLGAQVYSLVGDANALQSVLGSTQSVISNLILSPTDPSSLTLNLTNGFLASLAQVDSSSYGSLSADTSTVYQLAFNQQTSVVINNTLEAGQAQYVLIETGFSQIDSDPQVLPYVNISNPAVPLNGPGNTGIAQDTIRNEVAVITVKYGTPATSGSEVPPTVDSGNVAIAYIDLEAGQTTITGGQILDPNSVPGGSPTVVLAGLLNSHHNGNIGQAPKIHLASGALQEVQGELPVANMVASNNVGAVSTFREYAGNPNGNVAGNANTNGAADMVYDVTNLLLYVCTTTGNAASAVWTSVAAPLPTNLLYFGTSSTGNLRPLPTSGSASGEYYTSGAWTQTGALNLSNCRLFFGGTATFNAAVTVATEMPGGAAGNGDATTPGFAGNGAGLGPGGGSQSSGGGGGGGHGGAGGNGGTDGPTAGSYPGVGGATYPLASLLTGSGGGGGSEAAATQCPGGAGGGALYIESVGAVTFASGTNLTANGANGGGGTLNEQSGGGGGSGGGIQVRCMNTVTVASGATLAANGGNGGQSTGAVGTYGGGSGGGGIIDLSGTVVTNNGTITVNAGTAGTGVDGNGQNGAVGIINLNSVALSRRAPN
jgi:hypothetical protein